MKLYLNPIPSEKKNSLRGAKLERIGIAVIMLGIFFVGLIIMDQSLGLLGYPSEYVIPIVHPPNYKEIRDFVDYKYTFQTNSTGLRYREIPLKKPENTYRVFVLGDSFTEGMGMEIEETLPVLLESKFSSGRQKINFINGGLAGTGPFEYGRVLFNIGLKYQPDAVLICFFANDLSNMELSQKPAQMYQNSPLIKSKAESLFEFFLPRTYTLVKGLRAQQIYQQNRFTTNFILTVSAEARRRGKSEQEINAWQSRISKDLVQAVEEGRFYGAPLAYGLLRPNYLTDALDISSEEAEQKWKVLEAILSELINHSRDLGLEVGVVYLPDRLQYDPDQHNVNNVWYQSGVNVRKEWLEGEAEIEVRLKSWANTHGVPFMDLISTFRRAEKESISPLTWRYDNHWTAEGNRVATDAIAQWIKEKHVYSFLN